MFSISLSIAIGIPSFMFFCNHFKTLKGYSALFSVLCFYAIVIFIGVIALNIYFLFRKHLPK